MGIVALGLAIRLYGLGWGLPNVYEEAIPLKTAWNMWGWERPTGADFNPHFFNYPSLMFYVHFGVQGLTYGLMKLGGAVESLSDYQIQYLVDATPVYIAGRLISTLLALGTILLAYLLGRRLVGVMTGLLAALFMAVNGFHVERSQMIEVDVPLAFAVALALWVALRLIDSPTRRRYIVVGLAIGIAASTKYTGAMLIIPGAVAHLLARRRATAAKTQAPSYKFPLLALLVAALMFAVTSPYVILDFRAFIQDFALERTHMSIGHFGLGDVPSPVFYSEALVNRLLGWPLTVLSVAGVVMFAFIQRRDNALLLAAFVLPYVIAISTWSMHADRYLLPILPILIVFAAATIEVAGASLRVRSASNNIRVTAVVLIVLVVAAPAVGKHGKHIRALKSDPRTAAREWIEANVPSGSYIVTEPYGPGLFAAGVLLQIQPEARQKVVDALSKRPLYPMQILQMYQAKPEGSAVFYDLALYENADYLITSSAVRGRYERTPERFPRQIAFYRQLEGQFDKMREIRGGAGPSQIIYRNPAHTLPFNQRKTVVPPRRLDHSHGKPAGAESQFYLNQGLNYELYFHTAEAVQSYELALESTTQPGMVTMLVIRKTSCLLKMRRTPEALEFLETVIANTQDQAVRSQFMQMRERIVDGARRGDG